MPNTVMPRVPVEQMSTPIAEAFHRCVKKTGDGTIIEVMAHNPEIMRWYFDEFYGGVFYNRLPGMRLDVRSKELLRIKLSKQHGCRLCNRSNTLDAVAAGITEEMIDVIDNPASPLWTDKDRAVIALADEMALQNMDGHLSADLYARLRAHYDDAQIVELGFVAAILTGIAKWIFTFDIVDREETCPIRNPAATA
ncbi:carboxymuconolactone decarboxylase family protein [Niveispirillum fermenti]|uniref:carboxymuconolactone decarboxylase family protein n=1 Tax=Niveispirillum fermenti TaxID=1233113 RepID=UPI003A849D0D